MSRNTHRRRILGAALFGHSLGRAIRWLPVVALAASGLAHAQAWPAKTVRIVIPFSPGATTDALGRLIAQQLQLRTGQTFVAENKLGASGALGAGEVARAPADGYTLLFTTSSTHAVAPAMGGKLPYDTVNDFTPIAHVADSQLVLLGSPTLSAKNLTELLAMAREKPGSINYSSSGVGTIAHLTTEAINSQANVSLTHIPYKGSAQAMPDLISGAVQVTWDAVASGLPHVREGRVRALAVSGPQRSSMAPDVPTVAESGLPGFSVMAWFSLYGPKGMPPELAQRINTEVNAILQSPEIIERFKRMGIEPGRGSPADFAAMVANDRARWTRVVKERNLKPSE